MLVKAIANSASKNANMKAYLGETKFKMLEEFGGGRSEDDIPGIVGLANTVDHALHEFNIDGKGCMAKSMCDILYGEESEQRGMLVKAIANSASKNANMKAYLGETKFKMLEEFGAIK